MHVQRCANFLGAGVPGTKKILQMLQRNTAIVAREALLDHQGDNMITELDFSNRF